MTGNKVFLDSNVVIDIFAGNKLLAEKMTGIELYISSIVLGELYVGIFRVVSKDKHLNKLNSFLALCTIINIDQTTAQLFGEISADLYNKGKPIPTNDIWIAATVKQYQMKLISKDRHFQQVSDILIESW
jgi:tRNA(fMet)-specific endonuclease VapC